MLLTVIFYECICARSGCTSHTLILLDNLYRVKFTRSAQQILTHHISTSCYCAEVERIHQWHTNIAGQLLHGSVYRKCVQCSKFLHISHCHWLIIWFNAIETNGTPIVVLPVLYQNELSWQLLHVQKTTGSTQQIVLTRHISPLQPLQRRDFVVHFGEK